MKYLTGWHKVSDNVLDDPKLYRASLAAEVAFHRGLAYCSRHQTDGEIEVAMLELVCHGMPNPKAVADELVRLRLWTDIRDEGAEVTRYIVNNYLHWQPSRIEVEAQRAANAA